MKKVLIIIILFSILLCSCNLRQDRILKSVDSAKIIGKKSNWASMPYGKIEISGRKFINGQHHIVLCASYKNRVIGYVLDDEGIIIDYFFSKTVRWSTSGKTPLGTDHNDIIKKYGEPVFVYYPGILYENIHNDDTERFYYQYCEKIFEKTRFWYVVSNNVIQFNFNSDGKLTRVSRRNLYMP